MLTKTYLPRLINVVCEQPLRQSFDVFPWVKRYRFSDWLPLFTKHILSYCCQTTLDWGIEVGPIPPLGGVISNHSVGDAPTNPKFLNFYQFNPYFHLVKFFFVTSTKKCHQKNFSPPKRMITYSRPYIYYFSQFFHALCLFSALRPFKSLEYTTFFLIL